jgi:hypothetical protein
MVNLELFDRAGDEAASCSGALLSANQVVRRRENFGG